MDSNYPKKGERCAPYTILRGSAQAAKPGFPALEPEHPEHAETGQTNDDQVDGDDEIQEPRHNQNQNSRDQGNDRGNVRSSDSHFNLRLMGGNRIESRNLAAGAVSE
jgi:hypothetical protein